MKKLRTCFACMFVLFGGVNAATAGSLDNPEIMRPPVPRPDFHASQSNFAGFYAGALAAHGTASTEIESQMYWYGPIAVPYALRLSPPNPGRTFTLPMEASGWQGGVFVGHNWDVGQPQGWVLGVEADYMSGSLSYSNAERHKYIADIGQRSFSVSDQVTLRGRVGYDMGNIMPYVALGASCAHIETHNVQWMVRPYHHSGTQCGATGALGADVALGNNMFLGAEWRVTNYGDTDVKQGIVRAGWRF